MRSRFRIDKVSVGTQTSNVQRVQKLVNAGKASAILSGKSIDTFWIVDSRATHHMTGRSAIFFFLPFFYLLYYQFYHIHTVLPIFTLHNFYYLSDGLIVKNPLLTMLIDIMEL